MILAECGESIYNFITRVKREIKDEELCRFNDCDFYIRKDSHQYDICEKYQLLMKIAKLEKYKV